MITIFDIAGSIFLVILLICLAIVIQFKENIKNHYRKKNKLLVAIYRIPFEHFNGYTWKEYKMDVYCYEDDEGDRSAEEKMYGISDNKPYRTDELEKINDWIRGTSNLYNFPSYAEVAGGTAIFKNFT